MYTSHGLVNQTNTEVFRAKIRDSTLNFLKQRENLKYSIRDFFFSGEDADHTKALVHAYTSFLLAQVLSDAAIRFQESAVFIFPLDESAELKSRLEKHSHHAKLINSYKVHDICQFEIGCFIAPRPICFEVTNSENICNARFDSSWYECLLVKIRFLERVELIAASKSQTQTDTIKALFEAGPTKSSDFQGDIQREFVVLFRLTIEELVIKRYNRRYQEYLNVVKEMVDICNEFSTIDRDKILAAIICTSL